MTIYALGQGGLMGMKSNHITLSQVQYSKIGDRLFQLHKGSLYGFDSGSGFMSWKPYASMQPGWLEILLEIPYYIEGIVTQGDKDGTLPGRGTVDYKLDQTAEWTQTGEVRDSIWSIWISQLEK